MSVEEFIPQISYELLGLAMALAAFLPALLYTYGKGFLEERNGNDKYRKRILGFVYSIDLILTQSMILVFFSSLCGLFIFTGTRVNWSNKIIGVIVFILCIFYLVAIIISIRAVIRGKFPGWEAKDRIFHYITLSIICIVIAIVPLHPSGYLIWKCECDAQVANRYIFILAWLTGALMLAATIWIVPLLAYSPLGAMIEYIFLQQTGRKTDNQNDIDNKKHVEQ